MGKQTRLSFSELMRQQLNAAEGFKLIESAIADFEKLSDKVSRETQDKLWLITWKLRRALSAMRDLAPNVTPRAIDDGLHAHLREAHESLEGALGFLFLFQKEWDAEYALEFDAHCGGLHKASSALVKHLKEVGFK